MCALEGDGGAPVPSSLPSLPGWHKVNRFPLPCTFIMFCPATSPKSDTAKWPWNEISETVSQNKSFLPIRWCSQVFCHNNAKLIRLRNQCKENLWICQGIDCSNILFFAHENSFITKNSPRIIKKYRTKDNYVWICFKIIQKSKVIDEMRQAICQ
jgi:hypothetical protein